MTPLTNPPVELARYSAAGEERIVRGQRILGVVRLTDAPADDGNARRYVIERDLTSMREIEAIIADYLEQARIWDSVPAGTSMLREELVA